MTIVASKKGSRVYLEIGFSQQAKMQHVFLFNKKVATDVYMAQIASSPSRWKKDNFEKVLENLDSPFV